MKAEIVSIGTELLLGHILNTNSQYLSQKLAEMGIDVFHQMTVGDNTDRLTRTIKEALMRADIVITTGGLGPTVDDITIETVSKIISKRLILNKSVLKDLKDYFKFRNIKVPPDSIRQAYVPEGAKVIRNRIGTAPGLIIDYSAKGGKGKIILCLPGPPRELEPMFEKDAVYYLSKRNTPWPACRKNQGRQYTIHNTNLIKSRMIKTTGLVESQVNRIVKDLLELKPPTTVGIYAKLGEVDLKIMTKAENEKKAKSAIDKIERKIRARLKSYIFGYDDETLEGAVGCVLTRKKRTLAIAESCTGGLVSNLITNVSGSSKYFIGGLVAYSNESKENVLGVSKKSIKKYGAVSKQIALEMAKGIKYLVRADIALGITGIAGPLGGTKQKPVGLVYIAFVTNRKRIVKEFRFKDSREEIKFQASQAALDLIRRNA